MALFSRFFGRTIGEGAGVAIGTATAKVLEPILQELANASWDSNRFMPLEPPDAAGLRARETVAGADGIDLGPVDPSHEAHYRGLHQARFDALTELARNHPGVGQLIELRRRNIARGGEHGIGAAEFREGLRREAYPVEWIDHLAKLTTAFLSPEDVANAVQQGFVPLEGLLPPADLSGPPFAIPTEEVGLSATDEAQTHGIDKDRLQVLAQLSGNPPGPETLTELLNRGLITPEQWLHGLREGRTKTKWAGPLLALRHRILSAVDAANLRLRGWIDQDEAERIGALSGYSSTQMQRLYEMRGRPISPTQGYTAWARNAPHVQQPGFAPSGPDFGFDDFERAIRQSDIRPEWARILWHNRFAYPSLFQLRRAVQEGSISPARAKVILRYERYEDQDAAGLIAAWTSGDTGTQAGSTKTTIVREYESRVIDLAAATRLLRELGMSDEAIAAELSLADYRVVRSSLTAAQTKTRTLYVGWRITRLDASAELDSLGIPATAREQALATWDHERELNRPDLTPAQIATAAQRDIWTAQQAYDELLSRGYVDRDARVLLRLHKVTGP